jgi:hypothetical protein
MRGRPGFVSATGVALALLLLAGVAVWVLLDGLGLFSPGALNAEAGPRALGGVHSHAELDDRCGACHPAPWSGRTTADACLDCHTGVAAELEARKGLHGGLAGDRGQLACGPCHPEHDGPRGALTAVDESRFGDAHDATGFSLASHRETAQGGRFACADCHTDGYDGFDQAVCSACHSEIDAAFMDRHEATYGKDCLACHDGTGRVGADFDHDATGFPLEGKHADVPCADCHGDAKSAADLKSTPADCYACHAGDDEHDGAYGRRCGECHSAASWDDVTFDHAVFPLDHGDEERKATCETCHPDGTDRYTCYGCHEHTTANVLDEHEGRPLAELQDCVRCHPGGREAEDD